MEANSSAVWPAKITRDALNLHIARWDPSLNGNGEVKAVLVLLHGLGEHSGRYERFASALNKHGVAVVSIDHEGHGRSDGAPRAYFGNWRLVVADICKLIDLVNVHYPSSVPRFLFGHSMGGQLAIQTALLRGKEFKGIILSSPAIAPGEDIGSGTIMLVKVLNWVTPTMGIQQLDAQHISSIREEVEAYKSDSLNFHGKVPIGTGAQILEMIDWAQQSVANFTFPLLLVQAEGDKLVSPAAAKVFFDKVPSHDKQFIFYKGQHEIHNDVSQEQELKDIVEWITKRSV